MVAEQGIKVKERIFIDINNLRYSWKGIVMVEGSDFVAPGWPHPFYI